MNVIRVVINGFGWIGCNFFCCWLGCIDSQLEVVGINDIFDFRINVYFLCYDFMLGKLDVDISVDENFIIVNGKIIKCVFDWNFFNLFWVEWNVDLVIEVIGVFVIYEGVIKYV